MCLVLYVGHMHVQWFSDSVQDGRLAAISFLAPLSSKMTQRSCSYYWLSVIVRLSVCCPSVNNYIFIFFLKTSSLGASIFDIQVLWVVLSLICSFRDNISNFVFLAPVCEAQREPLWLRCLGVRVCVCVSVPRKSQEPFMIFWWKLVHVCFGVFLRPD